jgi:fido (protein-threonine AMPylation protein)
VTSLIPPYRDIDWDDPLEQTAAAAAITTRGILRVELWLRANASATPLTLTLVTGIHRTMFEGLFPDFAGRLRGPAPRYVPSDVEFGNYHGVRHLEVPAACEMLFRDIGRLVDQLDAMRAILDADEWSREALKVAAYLHCEIVRIHPFVNGNGRTARVCLNYFAWRYGMAPVAITRPKGEYLEANVTWLQLRVIEHMVDFLAPLWQRRSGA